MVLRTDQPRSRGKAVATALLCLAGLPALAAAISAFGASAATAAQPILKRHTDISREAATDRPKSEDDQAVVKGWPLYRTERGQDAYNTAMATLAATRGGPPAATAFAGCSDLMCRLELPKMSASGWMPAGRLWVSPTEYIVLVRSPRSPRARGYRRRPKRNMRKFIYHEFLNSTRNVDVHDTVSAHSRSVFTPFYMSQPRRDAQGYRFVTLIQTAPYNVKSLHARNHGNKGTGIEVAKNYGEKLDTLQAKAGIIVVRMVKSAAPQLKVVHHRGREGKQMLMAYQRWARARKTSRGRRVLKVPFVPTDGKAIRSARASLADLLWTGKPKPLIEVASNGTTIASSAANTAKPQLAPAMPVYRTAGQAQPARVATADDANRAVPSPKLIRVVKWREVKPIRVASADTAHKPKLPTPVSAPRLVAEPRLVTPHEPFERADARSVAQAQSDGGITSIGDLIRHFVGAD